MIRINLLPHREAAKKRRKEAFQVNMVMAAIAGLLIAGLIYWYFQIMIEGQQNKNNLLRSEIKVLETQIKEIDGLESEIAALRARQKAVEDLQSDRNLPVHMLNELVKQLPDGVYISSIKQEGLLVTMQGTAQSNERISEMLRNLTEGTAWFSKPELMEIVAKTVDVTAKDKRRAAAFTLRFNLARASDAEKSLTAEAPSVKAQ
ncbi:PilN domain-containing protein [Comamonas sp. Y33R10-2]|uniref:PilN domain-containing protein n=1 Tax=Comamonas sp. Y33R10-2 TaxID=2853257 RepID=UPI001C5CB023|nr:PilN domain-containing protein [Comamonas sp. Y33R10-2]QXZ09862.1 PilN domain-containing protein [Comamonas sp. Y33R10-2]